MAEKHWSMMALFLYITRSRSLHQETGYANMIQYQVGSKRH
jgi:hypothetical protein